MKHVSSINYQFQSPTQLSTPLQFIGKVTSLPFIQKLFGTDKDSTSRMARALLSSISEEDINEYTHMAIAAIDKFSEMNNFPK